MTAVYHVYKLQFQTQFHYYMIAHGKTCRNSCMHTLEIAYRAYTNNANNYFMCIHECEL